MTQPSLTFALHATSRGFGYVIFEGPFSPHDWGNVMAKGKNETGGKNVVCLRKLKILLDRFQPHALLLEDYSKGSSVRSERIRRLYTSMVAMAGERAIEVVIYSKADIAACFRSLGAITRQEIAEAVGRHIEAFWPRMPNPRRPWQSEDPRLAIFNAAALVLTHFQFGATGLFDQLSK